MNDGLTTTGDTDTKGERILIDSRRTALPDVRWRSTFPTAMGQRPPFFFWHCRRRDGE